MRRLARAALVCLAASLPAAAAETETLLAELHAVQARHAVPAFGLTLVDNNRILHADAHGIADLAERTPVDGNTRFRIGSITKAFTGLLTLIGQREGWLALDQPLIELVDPALLDNPWRDSDPVTPAQLLEHTAGLRDLTSAEMYHSDPTPIALHDAVREFAPNRRVTWRPGQYYSYSNAGAGLVSHALEQRSGERFEALLHERLFEPLGMHTASVLLDAATRRHLALGYDSDGRTPIPYWHMLFRAFGAINVRPADMGGFLQMLLNEGRYAGKRLFSPAELARFETPATTLGAQHGLRFGYGLGVYQWIHDGARFVGHGGDGDGYLAHFGYCRTCGYAYFVVINAFTHRPLREMRTRIESWIAARAPAPVAAESPATAAAPAFVGEYRAVTRRFGTAPPDSKTVLTVRLTDAGLVTQRGNAAPRALLPVTAGLFRRPRDPRATIAIVQNADGQWVWEGEREALVQVAP